MHKITYYLPNEFLHIFTTLYNHKKATQSTNSPPFMEPEISLLYLQDPSTGSILSQMHPLNTSPPYFPKIHSNTILPSTPRTTKCSLHIFDRNLVRISHLSHVCYTHRPAITIRTATVNLFSHKILKIQDKGGNRPSWSGIKNLHFLTYVVRGADMKEKATDSYYLYKQYFAERTLI
jgi:hypothetical protein